MGKKLKREEKPPPTDVFDPILIESKQAGTVVLMLLSPEVEVQAKACEAIYKFVDKSEDNKVLLNQLNIIEPILQLMCCEEKIVRRNATMVLGVMASHPDVRRQLRKCNFCVSTLISLLQPENDVLTQEFAALTLSYMSIEYYSKAAILCDNGMESLIRCLSSHDPDVQKNSIETLAQMMLDFQSRVAIRSLNGFPPILEQLKSEYAIIQKLALLTLVRATQEIGNRTALRELDCMEKLIDIVANPDWHDIHVMSVMVLSNMLEDMENLEKIKEGNALKKLVALLTDKPPPEEAPKKEKGSKSPRKGAKDAKKKGEEVVEPPQVETIIPTLPDVKMCAANAIARSARHADNRKILHEQEVEKMFILLLSHENPDVQAASANALAFMCENVNSRISVLEWDGFPPLIKLLNSDNSSVKEAASLALANLTTDNVANCLEVKKLHGINYLMALLQDPFDEAVANATTVLTNISQKEIIRTEAQKKGVVSSLVRPLQSSNKIIQSRACLAVAAYVCNADSNKEFRHRDGLRPLVGLLQSGSNEVCRNAAWAITICAEDEESAAEICTLGGLPLLQEIQLSITKRSAFTDAALEQLLDKNLSAKFSLTGYLGTTNVIKTLFFDAGQMKPGDHFISLAEHCSQPLDDRRAVILINTAEKKLKTTKERNEDEKENEQIEQVTPSLSTIQDEYFTPPFDANLINLIKEVDVNIQSWQTTRQQVITLAHFVSNTMGGPIARGQVSNFSWELPISEIRFGLQSNVVPIGYITTGIYYHRALLFKVLADQIAIACTLVRGRYNLTWNEVFLMDEVEDVFTESTTMATISGGGFHNSNEELISTGHSGSNLSSCEHSVSAASGGGIDGNNKNEEATESILKLTFPPKSYVVDLMHKPGRLMRTDSADAVAYQSF